MAAVKHVIPFSSCLHWQQAFACRAYRRCMLSIACMCLYSTHLWMSTVPGYPCGNEWQTVCVYVYSAVCLSWLCDGVNWANTASISSLSAGRWLDWLWAGLCTATLQTEPRAAHAHTYTHMQLHVCPHKQSASIITHTLCNWCSRVGLLIVFLIGNCISAKSFFKYNLKYNSPCPGYAWFFTHECVCVSMRSRSLTASPAFLFPLPNITFLNSIADVISHDDQGGVLLPPGFVY